MMMKHFAARAAVVRCKQNWISFHCKFNSNVKSNDEYEYMNKKMIDDDDENFAAEAAVVRRKQDWIGAEKLPAKETCSFATKRNYLMLGTKSIMEDI